MRTSWSGYERLRVLTVERARNVLLFFLTLITFAGWGTGTDAKTPGSKYCFYGTCHRVKTIAETEALIGTQSVVNASFYDSCKRDRYNPCGLTSSGEEFNADRPDNAASPIYPDGTKLLVWSAESKEALVIRVNNAGPYWGDRLLDVSRAAAETLGFKSRGVAKLNVRVLDAPSREEATYQRRRTYDPVPGHIGQYQTASAAHAGMKAMLAVEAVASTLFTPASGPVVAALSEALGTGLPDLPEAAPAVQVAAATVTPRPAADVGGSDEVKSVVRKIAQAPVRRVAAKSARAATRVAAAKTRAAKPVRVASADRPKATVRAKAVAVAVAAASPPAVVVKAAGFSSVAGAPNDSMSVFSRHNLMGATAERQRVAARPVANKRAALKLSMRDAGLNRKAGRRQAAAAIVPGVQVASRRPAGAANFDTLSVGPQGPAHGRTGPGDGGQGIAGPRLGLAQADPGLEPRSRA